MNRLFVLLFLGLVFSCSNDGTNRNPFLQDVGFRFDANLNLPLYSPLTNIGTAVLVQNNGVGTRGVFIINVGADQFRAFEASCPNHAPNGCSTMTFNGQVATCACEDYQYSLFNGQQFNRPEDGTRYYDMLEYNARLSGSSVIISN